MKYVRQRLIQLVIVVLAVTMLTFTFLRLLPGDPAISIAGIGANRAAARPRSGTSGASTSPSPCST